MNSDKIILIGAGGHCRACIDVIETEGKYAIAGVLEKQSAPGSTVLHYPIIGTDEMIVELARKGYRFLVTVGQIKSVLVRKRIFAVLKDINAVCPVIISPNAHVSRYAKIGDGTIVMHRAVVNTESIVGENCILNTGCIIEHETIIGNHCHVSTNAVVNGNCEIGSEVFIGSGTVISHSNKISDNVVIGGSSYVHKGISESGVYIDKRNKNKLLH